MSDLICKPFEYGKEPLVYKDAICLTKAEWDAIDDKTLMAMQDERAANWKVLIDTNEKTTPAEIEKIKQDVLTELADARAASPPDDGGKNL